MSRPDLDAIEARMISERCDGCGEPRGKHFEAYGDPAYLRQVSDDGQHEPDRCGYWVREPVTDEQRVIASLLAYARELETTLAWHEDRHGTRAEQEADDAEVEEEWSAVAALSDDEVRALNEAEGIDGPAQRQRFDTFLRVLARDAALRAERDELLLVIANERGEGEPPVEGWAWTDCAGWGWAWVLGGGPDEWIAVHRKPSAGWYVRLGSAFMRMHAQVAVSYPTARAAMRAASEAS